MRANPNTILFLALFASILPSTWADDARSQPVEAKRRTFYVPPDATEVTDKRAGLRALQPILIRDGGMVHDSTGPGPYYVEAGGTFSGTGGRSVVIVKKGGKVSAFGGKNLVFYEKGADITGAAIYRGNTLIAYDSIGFEKLMPFTLKGTVTDARGKSAAGVKVHAYDVGMRYLQSTTADADGAFVSQPKREVAYLVADFSSRCAPEDLELRLHVRPLQGWDFAIAEGSWAKDAAVGLKLEDAARFRVEPVQKIKTPTYHFSLARNNAGLASLDYSIRISLWDAKTGNLQKRIDGPPKRSLAFAYSGDAKLIAVGFFDHTIEIWQAATGAKVHHLEGHKDIVFCCAFSPDHKTLASGGADGLLITWDLTTGKRLHAIQAHTGRTTFVAYSPDGKTLLTAGESNAGARGLLVDHVRLWDAATGKPRCVLPGEGTAGAISWNGKTVATNEHKWRHFMLDGRSITTRDSSIVLANSETGKELFRVNNVGTSIAFSPDGRILLVATDAMTSTGLPVVHCYEVASGQEILSVPLPDRVMKSSWESSGQFLATISDSSVCIWDLRLSRVLLSKQQELTAKILDELWSDLAAEDAALAYRAVWKLAAAPEKAVALLKERLKPVPENEAHVRRLVRDLDNGVFAIRDKASQELAKMGRLAVGSLREAAGDKESSLETKRRLLAMVETLENTPLGRDEIRQIRAVGLLEMIASKEAHAFLETLTHGWSAARQTLEARESLVRLQNR